MPKYDPQNFESVILYMRQEFGASVFREPGRMYSIFCDLSPKLKPYGNVMRQLIERGALAELDAASGDDTRQARAFMKARDVLENELLLGAERVEDFLSLIRTLYGIAPPQPQPAPPPKAETPTTPKPAPTPKLAPTTKAETPPPAVVSTTQPLTKAETPTPPKPAPTPKSETPPKPQPAPPAKIVKRGECGDKGGNVTFTLDENGVLTISGKGVMRNMQTSDDIPWWDECEVISRVEIQDGVSSIGNYAFLGCARLKSVTIPSGVSSIGDGAFFRCLELKSVTIPSGVSSIGNGAFVHCALLESVTIPDSVSYIGWEPFRGCANLKSASVPAKAEIADDAFPDWTRIERRGA